MHSVARVVLALAAVSLSGCSNLNSETPLIAESDSAMEIAPGLYQSYVAAEPEQAAALAPAVRAQCFDPGYSVPTTGSREWSEHGGAKLLYCPAVDPDEPPLRFRIAGAATGYRVTALTPKDLEPESKDVLMRFGRLADGLWVVQLSAYPPSGLWPDGSNHADYGLTRRRGADLELLIVPCDDGMRAVSAEEAGVASETPGAPSIPHAPTPSPPPPPDLKCDVTSIDAIRPDLLRFAKGPDAVPIMILRRIGD